MANVIDGVREAVQPEVRAYQNGEDRPLSGYVLVMAVFGALVAGAAGLAGATGRKPPQLTLFDLLLITLGTHKLSRTISKDSVTSPLRAPFTQFQDTGGPGEVMEEVRSTGRIRHAIGELITCPFCLDVWIATGFGLGMVFAPRFTRLVAFTFAALTGADFLQFGYAAAQQAQE